MKQGIGRGGKGRREKQEEGDGMRKKKEKKERISPSPDPLQACVWPYAAQAECGKQTCSCTGGRRSSPRSSHGGT